MFDVTWVCAEGEALFIIILFNTTPQDNILMAPLSSAYKPIVW